MIYRDAADSCFKPIPLVPRALPPQPVSTTAGSSATDAVAIVRDVYRSTAALAGQHITGIRVVRLFEQHPQYPLPRSANQIEFVRNIVGTAEVQPDGSAAFRVPANTPLLFQLLDDQQRAVMIMRSQVFFKPGEQRSCVGCHESRLSTPLTAAPAWHGTVQTLRPPAGPQYEGGLSFARTVQPVLDRYCIRCHGLTTNKGAPDWRGTPNGIFSTSYKNLTARTNLTGMSWRRQESVTSQPNEYGSTVAGLLRVLATSHRNRVQLDAESRTRIVQWLDLNCPYYGDYGPTRPERRRPSAEGEKNLRAEVRDSCTRCHAGMEQQPLQVLINTALPEESRILKAPLASSAGGWNQCREVIWRDRAAPEYQHMLHAVLNTLGAPTETNTVDTASTSEASCN